MSVNTKGSEIPLRNTAFMPWTFFPTEWLKRHILKHSQSSLLSELPKPCWDGSSEEVILCRSQSALTLCSSNFLRIFGITYKARYLRKKPARPVKKCHQATYQEGKFASIVDWVALQVLQARALECWVLW